MDEAAIIMHYKEAINPEFMNELSRKVGFVKRSTSRLQGYELAEALIFSNLKGSAVNLSDIYDRMTQINPQAQMSLSALCQRLSSASCVVFMRACLQKMLFEERQKFVQDNKEIFKNLIGEFSSILLEDSTQGTLHESLAENFRGSGGAASSSAFKVNLIHNFTRAQIVDIELTQGCVPDQSLNTRVLKHLKPGDLVIRDLGYFALSTFSKVHELGAFYLSRFQTGTYVYLNQDDKEPLDIAKHVDRHFSRDNVIELFVYVGKEERLFSRMIIYRAPDCVINERLRKLHKNEKRKNRKTSKAKLKLLRFTIFITNVPREKLPKNVVGTLYRLRWECELIFKSWKSQLNIHLIKGEKLNRIICFIYARLCLILCLSTVMCWARNYARIVLKREISLVKLLNYLMRWHRMADMIRRRNIEELLEKMKTVMMYHLLKDKRKRKTTLGRIDDLENYVESLEELEFKWTTKAVA